MSAIQRALTASITATLTAFYAPVWAERPTLTYDASITIKAAPQKVWDSFKKFDGIHQWHPATEGTVLLLGKNGEPWAVRQFRIKGPGEHYVISELVSYKESMRWFKYRIIKTNLPLDQYVGEMSVSPAPDNTSVVHWRGTFKRPEGGSDDAATRKLVADVFKTGLDNLVAINEK